MTHPESTPRNPSTKVSDMTTSTNEASKMTIGKTADGLLGAQKLKRGITLALPLIALFLFLSGMGSFDSVPTQNIPTAPVKRGDVKVTITEAGELRAEHQATIQATTDKQITWMAPEGEWVKKGDPLIKFESSKYVIQRDSATSALAVTEAELSAALSDLQGRKSAERNAYLDYEALPELAEKGFINHTEVETARLTYEEVKSGTRSYEAAVTAARANVRRAEQELADRQRKLDAGVLFAPRGGLVVYATFGNEDSGRKITVGMTPFEGMDLMYLPDVSSMRVDTEISEFDLSKVSVGSPVRLTLDAYPGAEFRGEVRLISTLARQKISKITRRPTGIKVFDVIIQVLDQDDRLKPGLTTTADILVSEHSNVLSVPIAGVFLDDLDDTVVFVDGEAGVLSVPVEVVASSERVAIVSGGVKEDDLVLLAPPQTL